MTDTALSANSAVALKHDSVGEIIGASMVGTAIEFYDNYCYSIAAASYFSAVFFPKSDPVVGTLQSLLTFAISFLARPFGSLLFGHFGDKLGRKKTLVVALLVMGVSTFLVGVLPGYAQIGIWSVILLCLCRVCQGLGLAGEWSGAALVATENAPKNKRALYGSFPNLGAPIGFLFAYGLNLILTSVLSADQMQQWGWRMPFLLSSLLVVVGLYVRARMQETPVYRKATAEQRTARHPLFELRHYWRQVVLGMFAMGVTYTLFYILGTWSLSYGVKGLGFTQTEYLLMQVVSTLFFATFIVVSCLQADKFGRKRVLLVVTAAALVFSLLSPALLSGQRNFAGALVFLCLGFVVMGSLFGPCGAYLPEMFPMKVRYSGAGFSYNLAAILGGAFAPTIATWLVTSYGIWALGWYMGTMSVLALVALLTFKESKDVDFER
ncbi:MFS transporter [Bifidobacterium sp.]|jgi:metabolite-proton symporter|uniref:MFS transporter n=1 Tax=Bifidobacterium sp. TaxID=41200 RepID=UPI0025B9EF86|nr:MFS transporter [Bifidobacterium sp.]MCH4208531.1 MHS family MFS transporter [Bifidobacterium sp.]MCI1224217.1 MHS family MFS transporter [Bifidobacterium sp.]